LGEGAEEEVANSLGVAMSMKSLSETVIEPMELLLLGTIEELDKFGHLVNEGYHVVVAMPPLAKTLRHSEERLISIRRLADTAAEEIKNDFPVLHRQLTISLWSALEAAVRDVVVQYLLLVP
jgi:hypothetical protein